MIGRQVLERFAVECSHHGLAFFFAQLVGRAHVAPLARLALITFSRIRTLPALHTTAGQADLTASQAQTHADGRVFMWFAVVAVQGFEVEIELAQLLRCKGGDFQLNGHQTIQATVEEEQIKREVLITDLHRVFGADVAEVSSQLGQKPPQVLQPRTVQVQLGVPGGKTQKFKLVSILEKLIGLRMQFSQRC